MNTISIPVFRFKKKQNTRIYIEINNKLYFIQIWRFIFNLKSFSVR